MTALALAIFFGFSTVSAQTVSPDVVLASCTPNSSLGTDNTFSAASGDIVVFTCILENKENTKTTVFISGERVRENVSSRPTATTSVASAVEIPQNGTAEATIPFIALFENGTYHYTITLKDISDGKPFGAPLVFSSTLGSETASISDAVLDKESYTSEDTVSLMVTIATSSPGTKSKEDPTPFVLDVIVKDENGNACITVASNSPITRPVQSVSFSIATIPENCQVPALGVTVKIQDGAQQDSRDVPLTVSGKGVESSVADNSVTSRFILALLVIGALVGLAWALRVQRLRRRTTIL